MRLFANESEGKMTDEPRCSIRIGVVTAAGLFLSLAVSAERIGIVSDTHLGWKGTDERLEKCYQVFKAQKVDRIVNLGDICEWHNPIWYRQYVEIREKVYPNGVPPETYVFATHDRMKVTLPKGDKENSKAFELMRPLLKVTNERYDRFECAGYTFLVYPQSKDYDRMEREIAAECATNPGRPLFVLDHVPPANTVERSAEIGDHLTRRIFDRHPEVVVLSGHVHGSLAHEGKIWQGAFTALGFGTIKDLPCSGRYGRYFVAVMDLGKERAIVRRYDIESGNEINPESPWTLVFPFDPHHASYAPSVRGATAPMPAFARDAVLSVKAKGQPLGVVELEYPAAITPGVSHYIASVETKEDGKWTVRTQQKVASDYVKQENHRKKAFRVPISSGCFEENETVRFAVQPVDFYGKAGERLETEFHVGTLEKWRTLYEGIPSPAEAGMFKAFKGETWFRLPHSALDVPVGSPCRMVLDVSLDMDEDVGASFRLRTDKTQVYATGYIYTPIGKSNLRYVRDFSRPNDQNEDFGLLLQRAPHGKIRFNRLRIESRE